MADIPNLCLYRLKEKCMRFRFKIKGDINNTPDCMSRMYSEKDLEEVDNEIADLLDIDDMSDKVLGTDISASYIPGVNKCLVNRVGNVPVEDLAVTIPELAQKGAKDEQYKAMIEAVRRASQRRKRSVHSRFSYFSRTGITSPSSTRASWRSWSTMIATTGLGFSSPGHSDRE